MKFLIVTEGRTGSTALVQYLDSFPETSCMGEIFHGSFHLYSVLAEKDPVRYINQIIPKNKVSGCKIIMGYHTEENLQNICNSDFKLIFLYRSDIFYSILSSYLANKAQEWGDYSNKIGNDLVIDEESFDKMISAKIKGLKRIKLLSKSYPGFPIEYNELQDSTRIRELLLFIGVNPIKELRLPGKKIFNDNVAKKIRNLDYLIEKYKDLGDNA